MLPGYRALLSVQTNYNKSQQQCQIKNPGGQLTIRKVKEEKEKSHQDIIDQKQLTNFTHNIETIGPNVNSKKQQKQKIKYINIIYTLYSILFLQNQWFS